MSKGTDFVKLMSRHFVALSFDYQTFNDDGSLFHEGVNAFSGFIMEFHDRWYWTTAGHCFTETDKLIKSGRIKIHGPQLVDYFGINAKYGHVIPFWYEPGDAVLVNDPYLGLDFGLIPLPDLIRANLQTNDIIPITRANWAKQKELTFSLYKILGFPVGTVSETGLCPTLVTIERLDDSEIDAKYADSWFVGRVHPEIGEINIEGMSGGPIYGFRKRNDGQWSYHVVALQSWWLPDSRITFGCSVPMFAEEVHKVIEGLSS